MIEQVVLTVAALLFALGIFGVTTRKNAIGILLSVTSGLRGILSAYWFSRGRWRQRTLRV